MVFHLDHCPVYLSNHWACWRLSRERRNVFLNTWCFTMDLGHCSLSRNWWNDFVPLEHNEHGFSVTEMDPPPKRRMPFDERWSSSLERCLAWYQWTGAGPQVLHYRTKNTSYLFYSHNLHTFPQTLLELQRERIKDFKHLCLGHIRTWSLSKVIKTPRHLWMALTLQGTAYMVA